jgi:hypothetical protein
LNDLAFHPAEFGEIGTINRFACTCVSVGVGDGVVVDIIVIRLP